MLSCRVPHRCPRHWMPGMVRGLGSSDVRSHKRVTGEVSRKHHWIVGSPHGMLLSSGLSLIGHP